MDLSEDAIQGARNEASVRELTNIDFVAIDLSDFDEKAEPETFHFITTFDAVHDQARPFNVLRGIHRALRSDGVYLMQDIKGSSRVYNNVAHPIGTFLYTVSCMHCMTVSLAQGGEGLGAMWGEERAREYLGRAGFRSRRHDGATFVKLTDLHLVYQYNRWANDRVLGAAAMLPEEQLRRDVSTSHGSVWGTLVHIVWGEWLWLGRWQHRQHGPGADPTECCDLASLARRSTEIAAAQCTFLATLNSAALERRVAYENPPGVVWAYPLAQMLQHMVNHSTYHRGQVTTLLRQLGAQAVPTDFLLFIDQRTASG